jgi:hypothetical protein
MGWVNAKPRPLYPGKKTGTHCKGGWMSPKTGLGGVPKISPPLEFDPQAVHPVASRYTNYAIPAHTKRCSIKKFCVLPTVCIYVFFMNLRTNSDYFTLQH